MKATTFDLSRVFDPRPYRDVSPETIKAVKREADRAAREREDGSKRDEREDANHYGTEVTNWEYQVPYRCRIL